MPSGVTGGDPKNRSDAGLTLANTVRSTIQKRDESGRIRHGGEWLAIWSDPESLKSDAERRADSAERKQADFLRARILASARSLSGDPELELTLLDGKGASVGIQAPGTAPKPHEIAALRGDTDAKAAFHRYHDPDLHAHLRPSEPDEARLFDLIEHARCEGRAARAYPGLVSNLTAYHLARLARADLLNAHLASLLPLAEALRMVLRDTYAGLPDPSIQTAGFRMWDGWLRSRFSRHLAKLTETLENQRQHAKAARGFLADLFVELPSRGREVRRLAPTASDNSRGEEERALRETDDPSNAALFDPGDNTGLIPDQAPDALLTRTVPPEPYRAYTTRHDRIVRAEDLFSYASLRASRKTLDDKRADFRREVSRLSARLQRRLLAQQARQWEFDLEEGLIDASRLDRVVLSPGFAAAYKQEMESSFRETLVTLLIDNSGSMRGRPIETACITADIVAAALERCSISSEILGYTTSDWKGGQSARDWKAAGKPPDPGRLNDILHVIYKDADTPLRRARDSLCAMLSPSLLKENIDGEALIWAVGRMLRRPESRKLLIVISDGAPVDKATIEANSDKLLLDRHLRDTISWITRSTPIELAAIGLKHDVEDYYRNAVEIENVDNLADVVIALIDNELLDGT